MRVPPENIQLWLMSGRILGLILKKSGYTQTAFAKYLKEHKQRTGMRLTTSAKAISRLTTRRCIPDVYARLLHDFMGAKDFNKWLNYFKWERPEEFRMTA